MADIHFSDDAAKQDPDHDDALGYAPFSKRIADAVVRMRAPNGYVIAVQGAWGSGKSTVLNFTRTYIERHNEAQETGGKVELIDFRPWLISGHDDLVAAFFKVLRETLTPGDAGDKRLGKLLLKMTKGAATPLAALATTLATPFDPTLGVGARTAGDLGAKGVGALVDMWVSEPSLQSTYEALKTELAKSDRRFLVLIDDIDRLTPEEIRVVMHLVKSVGSLPNVIYLLAYDRRIVAEAFETDKRQGPTFVEKVVQHEVELPRPTTARLGRLLGSEIGHIIGDTPNSHRWQEILQLGVHRWIQHPRDAARLANALKFSWSALEGEIDAQDLVAMEGLRLFDPELFGIIRNGRALLLGDGRAAYLAEDQIAEMVRKLREALPQEDREDRLELLGVLFPSRRKALTAAAFGLMGESHAQLRSRRGIGVVQGYDAYFSLSPSEDAVPKAWIDQAVKAVDDQALQVAILDRALALKGAHGQSLIGEYLLELQLRLLGQPQFEPAEPLLSALFERGAEIQAADGDGEGLGPDGYLSFLIRDILRRWPRKRAGLALIAEFERSSSAGLCASIYMDRAMELGVIKVEGGRENPLIRKTDLEPLGRRALELIRAGAEDGSLADAAVFYHIARVWADLDTAEAPRAWLTSGATDDARFLAKTARGFLASSASADGRAWFTHRRPNEAWYDVDALVAAAKKHLNAAGLTPDERRRVAAVAEGFTPAEEEVEGDRDEAGDHDPAPPKDADLSPAQEA